jgi:phage gpG-like protein
MIANAIRGLRFDTIRSVKWELKPSVGIVAKDVQRLGMDIRSFREPLVKIVKLVLIPSIQKNFVEGGRPAWEPLAESTVRIRHYSAWPILQVTGKLKKRATQFNIWDIGSGTATIRSLPSDVFYGMFHQAGVEGHEADMSRALAAKPARKGVVSAADIMQASGGEGWSLPARPFIMYQEQDIPKMEAIFAQWMEERAVRSGRFRRM